MSRALALILVATAAAIAACGDDDHPDAGGRAGGTVSVRDDTPLAWAEPPTLIRAATGGRDQVVLGDIRNESARHLKLVAERVEIVDARSRALDGDARFTKTYSHGLYGPTEVPPENLPPTERSRLGLTVFLEPGGTLPIFAAFKGRNAEPPLQLDYGMGTLPVPEEFSDRSTEPAP